LQSAGARRNRQQLAPNAQTSGAETSRCVPDNSLGCYTWQTKPLMLQNMPTMALHFLYYNFVRIHQILRMTPAMAAGVTDRLWEMDDLIERVEAFEASRKRAA